MVFVNDAIAKMLDKPRVFLLGLSLWDAIVMETHTAKPCNKKCFRDALLKNDIQSLSGVYTLRIHGAWFTIEVTFGYIEKIKHIVVVIKDISEKKLNEKKLARETAFVRLHEATAVAANSSKTSEEAMQICLSLICNHTGWEIGHVYLVDESGNKLIPTTIWNASNSVLYKKFRLITQSTIFKKNEGLPGRVLASSQPVWINDVHNDTNFPRIKKAKDLGIKTAFAFPVLIKNEVVAVLEFFSTKITELDEPLLKVMFHIGTQLGRVVERKRAEEEGLRLAREQIARKEAEAMREKIQLSEIRYRTIIEQSPLSMQIFSPKGITLQVNHAWEKLWDVSLKDIDGYNILHDPQLKEKGIIKYIKAGFNGVSTTIPPIKYEPDKSINGISSVPYKWVQAYIYPVKNESGIIQEIILIHEDITVRKELERQKDDFIGIASHELKTPVTSLKVFGQVLRNRFVKEGNGGAALQLEKMDAQINRLTSLISDLLDVTKIESGKILFNDEVFDFDILIKEIVEQMQLTSEKHKILLKGSTATQIRGDKDRIGQVLINLLSNAIKYSPQSDKVVVKIKSSNNNVVVCVQDFGIGIPKAKQERIFERFFRQTGAKEDTFPGLGLGLFISKEIVTRQKGQIWVKSVKNKGALFCFSLPIEHKN